MSILMEQIQYYGIWIPHHKTTHRRPHQRTTCMGTSPRSRIGTLVDRQKAERKPEMLTHSEAGSSIPIGMIRTCPYASDDQVYHKYCI